jgi:phospholipase/lecithinase/hemolysin
MRKTSSSTRIVVAIAVLSLVLPAAWAKNGKKATEQMVTFGDSLSDAGNHFEEFREVSKAPFEPVPSFPYAIGGHHFSNGDTWIEQLTKRLGKAPSGNPASRSPGVFTNYAVGRARARANAPVFPLFDLGTQVNMFFADFGGNAPSDATYAIWLGSNDTRDALFALQADPSGATSLAIINDAVMSIGNNITALHQAGAREFLVLNVPNLAITPAVRALGDQNPAILIVAEQFSAGFNTGLDATLDFLEGMLEGIRFHRLDVFALLNELAADPGSTGIDNAIEPCLTFGVVGKAICPHPNRRLFWDAAHPTRTGHAAVAEAAEQLLTGP